MLKSSFTLIYLLSFICLVTSACPVLAQVTQDHTEICTYKSYQWSVRKKKAVNRITVKKKRSELTAEEKDPDYPQCTVCQEDQVEINIEDVPKVTVCKHFAQQVESALLTISEAHKKDVKAFKIKSLEGYRVGKTRGRIEKGLRMEFSNHSYGTAIDINAKYNGLYRPCMVSELNRFKDLKPCRLRHGGHWKPKKQPSLSISKESLVYQLFTKFWKWGGERKDRVKDFMHFSINGL